MHVALSRPPPAPSKGDKQRGGVLQSLSRRLNVADARLMVLIVGDQDLQVIDRARPVIHLDQTSFGQRPWKAPSGGFRNYLWNYSRT